MIYLINGIIYWVSYNIEYDVQSTGRDYVGFYKNK